MAKTKNRSSSIIFKAVSKNFINILIHYPKMIYMSCHPEKYSSEEQYDYCLKLIKLLIDTCNIKIEVSGLENIPKDDGFYLCSNHQEKFDPLAIWYAFPRHIGVILNDEATHRPFIREVCKLIKSRKLKNNDLHSLVTCFSDITKDLTSGINYMIFPEGWYESDYTQLSEFRSGCFKSPQRAHCKILPVALIDSYKIFDKGYKTTNPIQVKFLEPIEPENYANLKTQEIAAIVQSKIQKVVTEYQK